MPRIIGTALRSPMSMQIFFSVLILVFFPRFLFGSYNDLDQFPINENDRLRINHYLLPEQSAIKNNLDILFLSSRATEDYNHLIEADFTPYYIQPRSFIVVAGHALLPGYLVKLQLDTELRLKSNEPCWEWFIRRCEGAKKIQEIIDEHQIKHFEVAEKWLYPLPLQPAPPQTSDYDQKLLVVLVKDMNLVPMRENRKAWKEQITKEHLDELCIIMKNAYASSFRADNISFTKKGTFAFIDTEYRLPYHVPNFEKIGRRLNEEMLEYWKSLTEEQKILEVLESPE